MTVTDSKEPDGTTDTVVDDAIAVTINVTDVNEVPDITTTTSTISKPEGTAPSEVLETYAATDPDVGDGLTWTLTGDDAGDFTIVGRVLKFKNVPNFESPTDTGTNNVYNVTVNVSDGSLSDTQDVTITVTNVNEKPVITTSQTAISVPENTATSEVLATYMADDPESNPLTWSKTGDDADAFTIVGGVLKFSSSPNFESPTDSDTNNTYLVTVNVEDNNGGAVDDSLAVTVTVTNVDEAGTASFTGTLSGGSTLTASVTDPDGSTTSKTYRWRRSDSATSGFSDITNATGVTYVPVAADVTKYLRVKVNYTDGHGSGKSATSVSRGPINASNSEPTFSSMTATRT